MTNIMVNARHNNSDNGINIDKINRWLEQYELEFNIHYGIGWDWADDTHFQPVFCFNRRVDPKLITAFSLVWG